MATTQMRPTNPAILPGAEDRPASRGERRGDAALRLLEAERSEEIYPIVLEEIVALGFERAFISTVDFETGEILPAAALHCSKSYLERFRSSLYAADNPIVDALHRQTPSVIADSSLHHRSLYCHPILYQNRNICWEAEREHRNDCLAVDNVVKSRRLDLDEQVCQVCSMRAYAAIVAVELPRADEDPTRLTTLIELANRHLSRLFKVEHYYNRMRDNEITITQMQTVMQSMTDPVILTDSHYRVIMQNKAAERFFKVPEQVSEGLVR